MRPADRRCAGYTVIELILVLTILGIILASTVLNLEGISPRYRLRGGAREVGSTINWARSLAGGTGRTYAMHYDLDAGRFSIITPPTEDQDPATPLDERPQINRLRLPEHVRFEAIILADNTKVTDGTVDVELDPLGHAGSHIVYLANLEQGGFLSLKFSSMLGVVDFSTQRVEFLEYLR